MGMVLSNDVKQLVEPFRTSLTLRQSCPMARAQCARLDRPRK